MAQRQPTWDRPYTCRNFRVDLGGAERDPEAQGFFEVVFPAFSVPRGMATKNQPEREVPVGAPHLRAEGNLFLRRGFTGSKELQFWWQKACKGHSPRNRTVKVLLLTADHQEVVTTWLFRQVRPVSLWYSPLNALSEGVLMEQIELEFDSAEIR